MKAPNLGKRLKVGETFRTTTNQMTKNRRSYSQFNKELTGPLITYEVLRPGMKRFFTKGKRRYWCEVVALVETRTGDYGIMLGRHFKPGLRWWQFTYLVKILEA